MQVLENTGGKKKKTFSLEKEEVSVTCAKHGRQSVHLFRELGILPSRLKCPVCAEERELEERKLEEAEQEKRAKEALLKEYERRNIEPEFYDKTLEDYKPKTESQKECLEAVRSLIETKNGKLIVLGRNGTGKSMLAAMALKALGGVTYTMFQISLKIQSLDKKTMTVEQFANSLIDVPLLVIDEVGRSKGSGFEMNLLSYVLDKRHTRNKPFLILANLHFKRDCPGNKGKKRELWTLCEKCFESFFDEDLLSRFRQDGKAIIFEQDAPDWRNPANKNLWEA